MLRDIRLPISMTRASVIFVLLLAYLAYFKSLAALHRIRNAGYQFPGSCKRSGENGSKNHIAHPKETSEVMLFEDALKIFDADFFNDSEVQEVANGAVEFNIPIFKANRKLVATINGGLYDPSVLVFNPDWSGRQIPDTGKRFSYPSVSGMERPHDEENIAFMTVLELGELIKTKQVTSRELTRIFLQRLKRYDPVLEVVVSYTEDLAWKQAKEADDLIDQGVYLGTFPVYLMLILSLCKNLT